MKKTLPEELVAKRTRILDAAARVFAEKGFHATTVRDVAQAAGWPTARSTTTSRTRAGCCWG